MEAERPANTVCLGTVWGGCGVLVRAKCSEVGAGVREKARS